MQCTTFLKCSAVQCTTTAEKCSVVQCTTNFEKCSVVQCTTNENVVNPTLRIIEGNKVDVVIINPVQVLMSYRHHICGAGSYLLQNAYGEGAQETLIYPLLSQTEIKQRLRGVILMLYTPSCFLVQCKLQPYFMASHNNLSVVSHHHCCQHHHHRFIYYHSPPLVLDFSLLHLQHHYNHHSYHPHPPHYRFLHFFFLIILLIPLYILFRFGENNRGDKRTLIQETLGYIILYQYTPKIN